MRIGLANSKHFLLMCVIFHLSACSLDFSRSAEDAHAEEYSVYKRSGITFYYPDGWAFEYDQSPGFYSDRDISFDISEYSGFGVLIFNDRDVDVDWLMEHFVSTLGVMTDPLNVDVNKSSIELDDLIGRKLSWKDTFVDSTDVEFSLIKVVSGRPSVFATFHLSDTDISENHRYKKEVVKSILIN